MTIKWIVGRRRRKVGHLRNNLLNGIGYHHSANPTKNPGLLTESLDLPDRLLMDTESFDSEFIPNKRSDWQLNTTLTYANPIYAGDPDTSLELKFFLIIHPDHNNEAGQSHLR